MERSGQLLVDEFNVMLRQSCILDGPVSTALQCRERIGKDVGVLPKLGR